MEYTLHFEVFEFVPIMTALYLPPVPCTASNSHSQLAPSPSSFLFFNAQRDLWAGFSVVLIRLCLFAGVFGLFVCVLCKFCVFLYKAAIFL